MHNDIQHLAPAGAASDLAMSEAEVGQYSLRRAILAAADGKASGLEFECSKTIAQRLNAGGNPHSIYIPWQVQHRQVRQVAGSMISGAQRRDLTAGSASGGGYLVGTENISLIEAFRNRSVCYRMGAQRLPGLVGNVTISRQTGAATPVWQSTEASTITESQQTLGQLAMSPKTVGAYTEMSRNLMLQSSPAAESMVTADLGAVCGLAVDVGAIRGSGNSGEPTGIVNTSGIGSVTGASLDFDDCVEFQLDVAATVGDAISPGYVTTPAVGGLLMKRIEPTTSGTARLWSGNIWSGQVAGCRAEASGQMAAATMLFGDWSQLIIAEWGVLQIEVNPYANFQAGIIGVRAMVSVDVGLRQPAAFSLASSIT